MNNKIVSITKNSAIFLAAILIAGTIALSSPSFMTASTAQAQPYYDGMDKRYNSYQPDYPPEYKDSNSYNSYIPEYGMDSYKKPEIFPANKVAELG